MRLIYVSVDELINHTGKMATMEPHDLTKGINVSAYKLSLAKQLEENARRLKEHYQKGSEPAQGN